MLLVGCIDQFVYCYQVGKVDYVIYVEFFYQVLFVGGNCFRVEIELFVDECQWFVVYQYYGDFQFVVGKYIEW